MKRMWASLLFGVSVMAVTQQPMPKPSEDTDVLLVAVSRDNYMLSGGFGPSKWTGAGTVYVEPMARLTPSGDWQDIPCGIKQEESPAGLRGCRKYAREYLSKPHTYLVVSADGMGVVVHAAPSALSECFDYSGTGTYSGDSIASSAIASDSSELFSDSEPVHQLTPEEAKPIRRALTAYTSKKFDSTLYLRYFSLKLEGQELIVVQRNYTDISKASIQAQWNHIFAIGTMEDGRFHFLYWQTNTEDEDERMIGTIHLKSGRDFLIVSDIDPESQSFRVFGIRNGKLILVYSGGGSAC